MARKRLTQLFPFLLPLRIWQRNLFYQIGMKFERQLKIYLWKYGKKNIIKKITIQLWYILDI